MEGGEQKTYATGLIEVADGEWAGWQTWHGTDPYEDLSGPFYWRREPDGQVRCSFRAEKRHMNGAGFMHGGCIMTFADYCFFVIAREALTDSFAVTATFNGEFIGSVYEGQLVEGSGEVIKEGRSMVFVRGLISTDKGPVMSFSGVLKKTGPRK